MVLTLPLVFLSFMVSLDAFYCMVPVTGVALLLQDLITGNLAAPPLAGLYFVIVVAPMLLRLRPEEVTARRGAGRS